MKTAKYAWLGTLLLLVLGCLGLWFFPQKDPITLQILRRCPENLPTCVDVEFAVIGEADLQASSGEENPALVMRIPDPTDDSYEIFVFKVYGRLNDDPMAWHLLRIRRYKDGLDCASFYVPAIGQQGDVAVILTDAGPLEFASDLLSIGSSHNLFIIDPATGQKIAPFTPYWEASLWYEQPVIKADKTVRWLREKENICLDLESSPRFRQVPLSECNEARLEQADLALVEKARASGPITDPDWLERLESDLYSLPGLSYWVLRWGQACT